MPMIYNLFNKLKDLENENTHENSFCPVVNEDNNIPNLPNEPINGINLDTKREKSSIPRAGHDQILIFGVIDWIYPSPMQFYNALVMKNKDDGNSNYMSEAVKAHNEVNELSWKKILKWEKLHQKECKNPKLRRFVGKYNNPSPKSFFIRLFTRFEKPFDRHDWYIDRCGKEIRYILDYYDDPKSQNYLQVFVDVRPALDNFTNFFDRIKFTFLTLFKFIQ
ncbi:cytochrome C-type heme lyase, putative [Theileria annulata]|uniref:Holocytochrome c-type synthase n=1 Tax=Theileria annulata TaxID=5874 RepID=Q4UFB7_THEAN|nr:cytochrome C-type heme lyase, putative [Theileria annulata]CAI74199.1 cytochrome C-type heme lyase, putative [Theileria annulata]|eukprot:XP_951931.1 cytochrome C-type heme lyase, putative [Theileria annulata]